MSRRREERSDGTIFTRFSVAEDVEREIRAHLEMRAEELEREGWEPAAARVEARRLFGDREEVARRCRGLAKQRNRAVRRTRRMDAFLQDVRYALRTLARSPGFATVALLTLALGIGANTAIFSVVNGVLLRPLPYERPHELVSIRELGTRGQAMPVAFANYVDWRAESTSFSGIALANSFRTTVLGGEEPISASVGLVGEDFWKVFPVRPLEGRLTVSTDHVPGAQPVLVVSRSFWQNELGGRPIEALSLEVLGLHARVVGIVADGFGYPDGVRIWTPGEPLSGSTSRSAHNWDVVARMAPGVELERARAEVDAITRRVVAASAEDVDPDFLAVGAVTVPLVEEIVGDVRLPLYLLLGAASLVLLVACTNLASTLLARGTARARELAVRSSLGAGGGRIARQLLTESLLLAGLGALAGTGLAWLVVRGIVAAGPAFLPRVPEIAIDGGVLGYTAAVAVLTAMLFGLLPARRLTRVEAGEALRSGGRGNAADGRARVWRLLVGVEVALALVLLVGSALVVRSFRTLLAQDLGFDASDVNVAVVALSRAKYPEGRDHARFYDAFLAELERMPGVSAAGVMSAIPFEGGMSSGGIELDEDPAKRAVASYVVASAGAFEALDVPLVQGRLFDERDGPGDEHVAIVNRAFAERYWPGEDAVGHSVSGGGMDDFWEQRTFARVIGVVGDVRHDLTRGAYPTVYFPYTQRPFRLQATGSVLVEAAGGDPAGLTPALRDRLRSADPDVPVRIRPLPETMRASVGERRFVMLVLGGFSLIALILAGVGIFGVVSYTVARRTREMGIRMALGADRGGVLRLVMGAAFRLVAGGLVLGILASLAFTRVLRSLLFQTSPTDPLALSAAVLVLGAAALLASWLPARAATRVDPMVTMRAE